MASTDLCGGAQVDAEFALALVGGRLGFAPASSHEGKPRVLVEALFCKPISEIRSHPCQTINLFLQGMALA